MTAIYYILTLLFQKKPSFNCSEKLLCQLKTSPLNFWKHDHLQNLKVQQLLCRALQRTINLSLLFQLTGMFLGSDPCPQSYGRDLMSCAAQDKDHSQCCQAKGVERTTAGAKCLKFCQMLPGTTFQVSSPSRRIF